MTVLKIPKQQNAFKQKLLETTETNVKNKCRAIYNASSSIKNKNHHKTACLFVEVGVFNLNMTTEWGGSRMLHVPADVNGR